MVHKWQVFYNTTTANSHEIHKHVIFNSFIQCISISCLVWWTEIMQKLERNAHGWFAVVAIPSALWISKQEYYPNAIRSDFRHYQWRSNGVGKDQPPPPSSRQIFKELSFSVTVKLIPQSSLTRRFAFRHFRVRTPNPWHMTHTYVICGGLEVASEVGFG